MAPGGLLLLASALALSVGLLQSSPAFWHAYPYVVFGAGLGLSAMFNRSRLFFALLIVALSDRALVWLAPRLSQAGGAPPIFYAASRCFPQHFLVGLLSS